MFKFKCISSYCIDMENRMFVKAIRKEGNVDLIIYGKHTDLDTLTLMEVSGKIKNEHRKYLVVDEVNILDRFGQIRGSFSKLSLAMFFLEITYRSESGLEILLDGLEHLRDWDSHSSIVYFLYKFLLKNGVFNPAKFNSNETITLEDLLSKREKPLKSIDKSTLIILKNKLLKATISYLNQPLNTLKMLRLG